MRAALLCALVACAGCKSGVDDGYAIDLTLVLDPSISDDAIARIATIHGDVTGAETTAFDAPAQGKLASRRAGLRYLPKAISGTISFTLEARDNAGAALASGALADVMLLPDKTQLFDVTLSTSGTTVDGGVDGPSGDLSTCGNGTIDPGEACDPGSGSPTPCPQSVADCDDHSTCTDDGLTGSGCQAKCTHTNIADGTGCGAGGDAGTGVCLAGACCMGCIQNGTCLAGTSDAKACGSGGNGCFDCTKNSSTATCNAGQCSGCDATSCTTDGRTCGTSSCGYNCGGCPDACASGALTHYACVNKTCQQNGGGNCGLYATCASSTTCKSTCTGDTDCVSTAWCDPVSKLCKPKVGLGAACSGEGSGDHECAAPYVCSWRPDALGGYCTSVRCDKCTAATAAGDCSQNIQYKKDPRGWCTYLDDCHKAFCAGYVWPGPQKTGCDWGFDPYGAPRSCGAGATCNSAAGTISGSLCVYSSTTMNTTCVSGQTHTCGNSYVSCGCAQSNECDYSNCTM